MIERKKIFPILFVFAFVNILLFLIMQFYQDSLVKINFLMVVNLMLLSVSFLNYIRLIKANYKNPNALVRSVIVGTMFKMLFFAVASLAYAFQVKATVGMPTLLSSMVLYLIYTWIEVSWTQIKK
jgi:hypothetical protein